MALQQTVEQTVAGLGYELIEIDRSAGGLLRVTIDLPWTGPKLIALPGAPAAFETPDPYITVEDCEKVTRQLLFALEVDGADYKRLEVSSPGIDRPLRNEQDFERFLGETIDVTLKEPIGAAAGGQVSASRKKFRGTLERAEKPEETEKTKGAESAAPAPGAWQLVWGEEPKTKPGHIVSKKRVPAPLQALGFTLHELREARLAPIVDFKGRKTRTSESSVNGAPEGVSNTDDQDVSD